MRPDDEDQLQSIFDDWEKDTPGVTDIDTPPTPPEPPEGPEYRPAELAKPPEPAIAPNAPRSLQVGPVGKQPPMDWPEIKEKLKAVGPGKPGTPSTSGSAASSAPDWGDLQRRLGMARINDDISRSADQGFGNIGPGKYKSDPGGHDSATDMARLPLELAKERQGYEGRELDQKVKTSKLGADAAMKDPNSLQSQKAREAFKAFVPGAKLPPGFDEWSAADVLALGKKAGGAGGISPYQAEQMKRQAAEDERKRSGDEKKLTDEATDLEHSRKNYAGELTSIGVDPAGASQKDIDRALQLRHTKATEALARKADARSDEPKLAPTVLNELSDFDVADKALGQLESDFNTLGMSGPMAKVSGKASEALGLTGTDAAVYQNKAKQAQQVVGKILEGGKLAAGDEAKYKGLIPQPGDSQELLKSKVSGLRNFLGDMKSGRIQLYKSGGYKTPGGSGGTVKMKFPDGSTADVDASEVDLAKRKGGVPANG